VLLIGDLYAEGVVFWVAISFFLALGSATPSIEAGIHAITGSDVFCIDATILLAQQIDSRCWLSVLLLLLLFFFLSCSTCNS
jgi:hypothetical protein